MGLQEIFSWKVTSGKGPYTKTYTNKIILGYIFRGSSPCKTGEKCESKANCVGAGAHILS